MLGRGHMTPSPDEVSDRTQRSPRMQQLWAHTDRCAVLATHIHHLPEWRLMWSGSKNHTVKLSSGSTVVAGLEDRVYSVQFSHIQLSATPWIEARQASLSITNSRSSPRLTSIESVMPSSHLILCCPSPAPNPSQHQSLFQWVNSSHEVAKVLEFQL